jgi:hypothetical protein
MSVPQGHLVAFCSDIGISPTRSATMLSVMLASAFVARQAWGAGRSYRRPARCGRLGLPGARHHRLLADPGRSRPVRHRRRFRPGIAGIVGLMGAIATCSRRPGVVACPCPVHRHERHGGGQLFAGLLYDPSATTCPPSSGVIFNVIAWASSAQVVRLSRLRGGLCEINGSRRWPDRRGYRAVGRRVVRANARRTPPVEFG